MLNIKFKKIIFLLLLFISFINNSKLSTTTNITDLPNELIDQIFVDYAQSNPNDTVKDFLKFIATQSHVNHNWHQIARATYNRTLNFCKKNRLDITTLKISQYFQFYRECLQDSDYCWSDLNDYQTKDYYKNLTPLPEEVLILINDKNTNISNLLIHLEELIDLLSIQEKMLIKSLKNNIENLCKLYDLDKNKSLYRIFRELISSQEKENEEFFSALLFLGIYIDGDPKIVIDSVLVNPLYTTIAYDKKKYFLLLLKFGANVNIKSWYDYTLLHEATRKGNDPEKINSSKFFIYELLKHGANPMARSYADETALDLSKNFRTKNILRKAMVKTKISNCCNIM